MRLASCPLSANSGHRNELSQLFDYLVGACGSCATAFPSGALFWNFKLREGVNFSDDHGTMLMAALFGGALLMRR